MDPRAVMRSLKAAANLPAPATNQQSGGYGTNSSALYAGQISPLVAQYQQWNLGRPYGTALPRDTGTFLAGAFGPLAPIQPVGIDDPDPDTGRPSPRRWQYPVGWNMPVGQPGTEGLKLASFTHLRTLADTYSVARACIQVRIQEILSLEWDIVPTAHAEKQMRADSAAHRDFQERRAVAMKFFKRPDSDYLNFSSWLSACLEEVFTIDALSLYLWPTRKPGGGPFGSDLGELALIAGDTIRPLVDLHGGRPKPPNPAYQQYLYGVPRTDLMTMLSGEDAEELGEPARTYRSDQLLYMPFVRRSWTPYGFPPLERVLIPVMSGLRKQQYQLDFFSEGTIPGLFVSPGDMAMTPNQIQQLQEQLNSLAGDPAWKHKIIVLPPGSKTMPQKPTELADQFDEIIMNQTCMGYDVMPMELGIAPKVSTTMSPGAANQMAKMSESVMQRKALRPFILTLKSIFEHVMQDVWGQADMAWTFAGLEQGEDAASQTEILIEQVSHGLKSIDEARNELGGQPWGLPLTSDPVWATQSGIVPVGAIDPTTGRPAGDQPAMPTQAGTTQGAPVAAPSAAAGASTPASTPGHAGASAGQDAAQQQAGTSRTTTRANPPSGQAKPSGSGPAASPQAAATSGSAKGALTELDLMRRRLRKGRDLTDWELRDLPQPVYTALLADLEAGVPTTVAIGKARDALTAHDHLDRRETIVSPLADHYSGELMRQSERLKAGEISPAGWLDTATAGMHGTVQTALHAGARHALADGRREKAVRPQLAKDEGDDAEEGDAGEPDTSAVLDADSSYSRFLDGIATREADTQHGYLAGLLQDVLAATALEAFTNRFNLYGAAARSAYEEGYGLTLTASAPDDVVYEIVWHTTSSRPCAACNARNGQSYTTQSLPGWPGDGGFGPGALCYGGAFCKCYLEWRQQDSSWSAPINPLLGSGEQEQYDNQQAMQAQRLADVADAREAFVDSLPEAPAQRAAARDAARAQLAADRGGWPSDVPAASVADVLEAHGIPTGRRPVPQL